MPIYLLTPKNLSAPDWEMSTHKAPVQIEATSTQDARIRAAMHFGIAVKIEPGAPTRFNPWSSPDLAACEILAKRDSAVRFVALNDDPEKS